MSKIEKIKQYHNLSAYAARLCGGLKKSGHSRRYLVGYCPFCQPNPVKGKRQRFWVDTELLICGCFKCQMIPMDIINLYAAINHLDNLTAVADLYLDMMTKDKPSINVTWKVDELGATTNRQDAEALKTFLNQN